MLVSFCQKEVPQKWFRTKKGGTRITADVLYAECLYLLPFFSKSVVGRGVQPLEYLKQIFIKPQVDRG